MTTWSEDASQLFDERVPAVFCQGKSGQDACLAVIGFATHQVCPN